MMKNKLVNLMYGSVLFVLFADILIALVSLIEMITKGTGHAVFVISLLNPVVFLVLLMDNGQDVIDDEVEKRLREYNLINNP